MLPEEINEYLAYAIEGRRRVKEQLNKKKPDDEFANINLGYMDSTGKLIIIFCPESKDAAATQSPVRAQLMVEEPVAQPATTAPKQEPAVCRFSARYASPFVASVTKNGTVSMLVQGPGKRVK